MSQRDLARLAKSTPAAVCHIERGIRNPSASLLARLAAALKCSTDWLLTGKERPTSSATPIDRVATAMKTLPPSMQEEVLRFCRRLQRRD